MRQIVIDTSTLVAQMPEVILGFFFINDRDSASRVRQQFLQFYHLDEKEGPVLARLDLGSPDAPFALA